VQQPSPQQATQIVNFPLAIALLLFGVASLIVAVTVSAVVGGIMMMIFGLAAVWLGESVRRKTKVLRSRMSP
jgi:hypothetical protein